MSFIDEESFSNPFEAMGCYGRLIADQGGTPEDIVEVAIHLSSAEPNQAGRRNLGALATDFVEKPTFKVEHPTIKLIESHEGEQ